MTRLAIWWRSLPPLAAVGYVLALVLPVAGLACGIVLAAREDEQAWNVIGLSLLVGLFFLILIGSSS
jgi:hypothetical protein